MYADMASLCVVLCMHVFLCVYVSVRLYPCVCVYPHARLSASVWIHVPVCVCVCVCAWARYSRAARRKYLCTSFLIVSRSAVNDTGYCSRRVRPPVFFHLCCCMCVCVCVCVFVCLYTCAVFVIIKM